MEDMTLKYYNENCNQFVDSTLAVDMSLLRSRFLDHVKKQGRILDLGCGSGRDSLSFIQQGYAVTAVDGSAELCAAASRLINQPVLQLRFQELSFENEFDGIWACSSLLHVAFSELPDVFKKLYKALKADGILYLSFKYGTFEGERNGRFFTDCDEHRLQALLHASGGFQLVEQWITEDARPDRNERWLNALCKK